MMRKYIDIINEQVDPINWAMSAVANYIQHNADVDLRRVSQVLKENGYEEPFSSGNYFRALFHFITDSDRHNFNTIGELFEFMKHNVRMELTRVQGFTTSLDHAIRFIESTLHISHDIGNFPVYDKSATLEEIKDIVLVYEVKAHASQILLSMRGLKKFLEIAPDGQGKMALDHALNDLFEGYGSDDEVVIDTSKGAQIVTIRLYETPSDD
jgi:hypothetical protein